MAKGGPAMSVGYERFTDRARKVMQLARQEAQRFSHEYIGTEHILLGLVKEGSGVAANALKNLEVDLRTIRQEVERIVQPGPDGAAVTGGAPQTPRAKKVIEHAIEEARNLNHNYVGTEHLLLGLVREEEGVASQVLMNLGQKLADLREEVLNLLGHNMKEGLEESLEKLEKNDIDNVLPMEKVALDLTDLACKGKLAALVGRQAEIERILMVLSCRARKNALLVGEVGSGRSSLI